MLDPTTIPVVGGVIVVVGAILKGVPLYDEYNRKKAKAARDEEEAILQADRERIAAEESRWAERIAAVEVKWQGTVDGLKSELADLRARVKQHEHIDAKNRQTMYVAAVNLKGIAGAESVMADLLKAAEVPEPKP